MCMTNNCERKRDNIELKVQYFSDCRGDLASGPFLSRLLLCFGDLSPWLGPPPPNRGSSILPAFGIAVRIPCYKTLRLNLRVFVKIFSCIFSNHSFFHSSNCDDDNGHDDDRWQCCHIASSSFGRKSLLTFHKLRQHSLAKILTIVQIKVIFIGPKSDHCFVLSVCQSLSALLELCSSWICQSCYM